MTTIDNIKLIYILGNSHTGSTILGLYVGLHPFINYVGETKQYDRTFMDRTCTCGKNAKKCPVWGPFVLENKDYFDHPKESNNGIYRFYSTFKSIFTQTSQKVLENEKLFLENLYQLSLKNEDSIEILLDSSKSLKRFITLSKIEGIELYPIILDRELRSNLASFVKRGKGLLRSYLRLKINKFFILNYMNKRHVTHLKVSYEDFVNHPDEVRREVLDYVGIPADEFIETPIDIAHQISGNHKARYKFLEHRIRRVQEDDDLFSPIQKRILRLLGL